MEKEQKKLLLVAVSVGVFLLVTITVAIIILTPKLQTPESSFTASSQFQTRIQPADNPINTPVINNIQETVNITENPDTSAAIDKNDGERLTIQIPKPTTAAVPDNPEVTAPATVRPQTTATPTATANSTPARQTTSRTTAAQPAAAARPAASVRTVNDYWIQTGAFSAKVRAEDAKDLLASKGLISIIENREVNGSIWYRVRLGPYTSEKEANYWLALVQSIEGFAESQIRQTVRQQ